MRAFTKMAGRAVAFAIIGASIAAAQSTNTAQAVDGRWDASLVSQGQVIPFRLDIAGSGPTLKGIFYDGKRPNDGTSSAKNVQRDRMGTLAAPATIRAQAAASASAP